MIDDTRSLTVVAVALELFTAVTASLFSSSKRLSFVSMTFNSRTRSRFIQIKAPRSNGDVYAPPSLTKLNQSKGGSSPDISHHHRPGSPYVESASSMSLSNCSSGSNAVGPSARSA